MAPTLAGAAAAQREGKLGAGQVTVIRRFYHQLPGWVDAATRDKAEADLAEQGTHYRPEQLQDAVSFQQDDVGVFEIPKWDPVSQKTVRDALLQLSATLPR